jgi:hypothetical protein
MASRKLYCALAAAIKESHNHPDDGMETDHACVALVAQNIAAVLKRDNPMFDRERFITACDLKA